MRLRQLPLISWESFGLGLLFKGGPHSTLQAVFSGMTGHRVETLYFAQTDLQPVLGKILCRFLGLDATRANSIIIPTAERSTRVAPARNEMKPGDQTLTNTPRPEGTNARVGDVQMCFLNWGNESIGV